MTYETTIAGEDFVPFIKAATDFVGDARVTFEDHVVISSMDTARVLFVDTAVRNPNPPPSPVEVILDLRSLAGVTSTKHEVTISIPGNGRVGIKTGRMEFTLPEVIDPSLKNRKLPDLSFPVMIDVKSPAFVEGVQGMLAINKAIEELIGFWFIAEGEDVFYFQDKMKQHGKAIFYPGDEYSIRKFDNPAASLFSVDYLEDMTKHLKLFETVRVCLDNNAILVLVCANENRKLAYALANRMPDPP